MSLDKKIIGFIGGGNMAKAIVSGILNKGVVKSSQIIVSSPSESTLNEWKSLGVNTTPSNSELICESDIIFFTFKPYQLKGVVDDLKCNKALNEKVSPGSKLFVSVLAGISLSVLWDVISEKPIKIGIPTEGKSHTLTATHPKESIALHPSSTANDAKMITEIFSSVGKCEILSEEMITAVTGLTGSGPAYVYTIIEALSDGGVKQGLPRNLATVFAAQTLLGASKMVLETGKHPGELKDEVCSAGGTTIYGIHALEQGNIRTALMNAVEAAVKRGVEIGKQTATN